MGGEDKCCMRGEKIGAHSMNLTLHIQILVLSYGGYNLFASGDRRLTTIVHEPFPLKKWTGLINNAQVRLDSAFSQFLLQYDDHDGKARRS